MVDFQIGQIPKQLMVFLQIKSGHMYSYIRSYWQNKSKNSSTPKITLCLPSQMLSNKWSQLTKVPETGLLIFRAVAEPRISTKSAKLARNLTKYMSAQYIWKLSWLLGLLTCYKHANLHFVTAASKQHPKTTSSKKGLTLETSAFESL